MNIRYIFTGMRNKEKLVWRCPSFAINIGVKQSKADYIILTCPEIYHLDKFAIKKVVHRLKKAQRLDKRILVKTIGRMDRDNAILPKVIKSKGNIIVDSFMKRRTVELKT